MPPPLSAQRWPAIDAINLFRHECSQHRFELGQQRGTVELDHCPGRVVINICRVDQEDHLEAFILPHRAIEDLVVPVAGGGPAELAAGESIAIDRHLARDGLSRSRNLRAGGDDAWVAGGGEHQGGFDEVGGGIVKGGVDEIQGGEGSAPGIERQLVIHRGELVGVAQGHRILSVKHVEILGLLPRRVDGDAQVERRLHL